ncbi:hypothetical protein HRR83_001256 [Exophiala dermatitidis]|uniref:Elongin-A n=2 Tax=Exophiala dermatitidis TaxID=5970 RepID=H6C6X4_EXODN|nr:uncharacterized protein HMPREF1120_07458 [Exophiala dermatitidis NIH/UT8656]KAJ4522762.1 hypothetical protein HRR75_001156 [Exophiala dermatitidis]EHY59470.1 hypothetical protein HMPREF1120_07458 [Exophiala dermatitidis NIH/UT8656]KAJ4526067.1 hypothetical protein HRR74_001260 [Exophiala dermatitidis]KAJ4526988.1 hypothetical protein HRR73_001785 [Exophiala dermatitidis]KAJ4532704.1 hypothetical protein HRR76_007686 [Exophiala dermatitidis]
MPADSLLAMARRACGRYSARITDIGDLDYELVRPVLMKIENPEKLHQIEQASPQIIGLDAELWLNFIKRDIPDWHLKPHEPKDPKNWYKVYRKLKAEAEQDSKADEAMLKAALANIKKEKEQNVVEIANRVPGSYGPSRRARIFNNYVTGRTGSKGANKMTLMEKIRKEARDAKASRMNRPMHELPKRATPVITPPQRFVEDLKQKAAAAAKTVTVTSPPAASRRPIPTSRPPLHAPRPQQPNDSYDLTRDREARLRALKAGKTPVPTTSSTMAQSQTRSANHLTLDFLEDDDGPDDAMEEPPRKMRKVSNEDVRQQTSASPVRLNTTTQPPMKKRKMAPSLFLSSKRPVTKPPAVS